MRIGARPAWRCSASRSDGRTASDAGPQPPDVPLAGRAGGIPRALGGAARIPATERAPRLLHGRLGARRPLAPAARADGRAVVRGPLPPGAAIRSGGLLQWLVHLAATRALDSRSPAQ